MNVAASAQLARPRPGFPLDRRWLLAPILALVLLPILLLASSWLAPQAETWAHLSSHLLPRLIGNTALMVVVVGAGVTVIGVGLAWLSACCEYPGRRWLDPLLILPLAFPTYVLAFIYLGIFEYAGPVQMLARDWFGHSLGLEVFSQPGAVLAVMILAFFPYVYLLTRASFLCGALSAFEAGRSLGRSPWGVFITVSLPASRPAIAAGLALALMETLADFGAVSIYGFDTFTTAIYRTWTGLFNLPAATQLASLLMLFMLVILALERTSRGAGSHAAECQCTIHRIRLQGWRRWAACGVQLLIVLLGVVIPLIQLLVWSWPDLSTAMRPEWLQVIGRTMLLGAIGAGAVLAGGLLMLLASHRRGPRMAMLAELAAAGYAIPGAVLAVAILLGLTGLDRLAGTTLAGGLGALILAYLIRFVRVAWGPLDGVAARLRPELSEAARSLGAGRIERWWRITLPLLRPGLLTAFGLALVEIAKEMPATLMLRPFGWETLAVRIYGLTMEGHWQQAALPAMILVGLGAIPAILLIRRSAGLVGSPP